MTGPGTSPAPPGRGGVTVAAVDLGATSGRVMLARIGPGQVDLQEVHRFANAPVHLPSGLHWNVTGLFEQVLTGLRAAQAHLGDGERIASIGIDSWAVDYGLTGAGGEVLGLPYCYRDERTARGVERVHALVPPGDLYLRNGLQFLPFNTLYQLAAEPPGRLASAGALLLLPDLFAFWLTGAARAEVTNASTTGLLDVRTRAWDTGLATLLGLPAAVLPPLVQPGEPIGTLLPQVAAATGLAAGTPVVAVGSHDTASAVAAVPAGGDRFAYVSSGTWSLVGLELPGPVVTAESRAANFTNEGGVDGTVRFLRNVMGLWLLSESLRTWEQAGTPADLHDVLAAAAALPAGGPVFDPDDPVFLPPGDQPARIGAACRASGLPVPDSKPALVRLILESLAAAYARAVSDAVRLTGREVDVLHLVGGGSRNRLLCQLTARATGRPVLAGPVEATALGNALVQARAAGAVSGTLTDLRALLRDCLDRSGTLTRYEPSPAHPAGPGHQPGSEPSVNRRS